MEIEKRSVSDSTDRAELVRLLTKPAHGGEDADDIKTWKAA
jgi:hypothetical protein